MKWAVLYSPRMEGPFKWVADEYGEDYAEIEHAIRYSYSHEETPVGFYKLRPAFGPAEYLIHKAELYEEIA